ncbi:MAG TPA: TonB family protein [Vicinamibacterales bacterium]|nr:TonB family protein [Vicinamibacterales bacterium]
MSEHLFADARTTRTPSRQSSLVVASILVHVAVLIALLIVEVFLPGVLPTPHIALAWSGPRMVRLADIPLPPPRAVAAKIPAPPNQSGDAAPVDAPNGITPEPERLAGVAELPGTVDGPGGELNLAVAAVAAPAPPPPAPPTGPVRLHRGIDTPIKIHDVTPVYPALARTTGAHGVVIIEATIDARGEVVATTVLRSVPMLDQAAVDAVRQWKYTPARLNGDPVAVLITVTVNFMLAGR